MEGKRAPTTSQLVRYPTLRKLRFKDCLLYLCLALNVYFFSNWYIRRPPNGLIADRGEFSSGEPCPVPLPTFLAQHPPSARQPSLRLAARSFDKALANLYRERELDSVAVAIVTSEGSLYEGIHGVLKANETTADRRGLVDRHSIFRIASVSKMVACLEALILRNRGALNLDDPISKFIPDIQYTFAKGSREHRDYAEELTFRQLMSHMAGLGRMHPSWDPPKEFPEVLDPDEPLGFKTHPIPNITNLLEEIAERNLVTSLYKVPAYSNMGFALLGVALHAAARVMEGDRAPGNFEELVTRDIFDKLGMEGSSFLAEGPNKDRVVVPSHMTGEVDDDWGTDNAAGGQFSSLSDLALLAQSFLNPTSNSSLLPLATMFEWFKPAHGFGDGVSSVGLPWEMTRMRMSFGRTVEEFSKSGSLTSQFSEFAIFPSHSFAIIALSAGKKNPAIDLHHLAIDYFLPAFDRVLIQATEEQLSGIWTSSDRQVELHAQVTNGALIVSRFMVGEIDALKTLNRGVETNRAQLWDVGNDQFRLLPILPRWGVPECLLGWARLDDIPYMNGYAINTLRLVVDEGDTRKNKIEVPAIQATLYRG